MSRGHWFLAVLVVVMAGCATQTPPPAPVRVEGDARFLIDPRIGYGGAIPEAADRKFEVAWRSVLAGEVSNAKQRLDDLRSRYPDYAPARLAEAAMAIRAHDLPVARAIVRKLLDRQPAYTAAAVYDAEIELADQHPSLALEKYRLIQTRASLPDVARERFSQLEGQAFEEHFHQAQTASDADAVRLLREALAVRPGDEQARVLLVQKLIAEKNLDEARKELDPLLGGTRADTAEVQEALAEIDAGRGRYQEAIIRLDRLAHRHPDPRYTRRLEQLKDNFAAANMPTQYQRAAESESLSRADAAVLLYWRVASVRFAQGLGAPSIAIDVADVPGREELIRAIALGIFNVDPITRRVDPYRAVNSGALARMGARVLAMRGASCAKSAGPDPSELGRAEKVLAACSVLDPSVGGAELPAAGRTAIEMFGQIHGVLSR